MRKKIVAGNWKMNLNDSEASELIQNVNAEKINDVELIIFPPFLYLDRAVNNSIQTKVGAQNCYPENSGAFTGEISPEQLQSVGVEFCLVGHSERRSILGESNAFLKSKVNALLSNQLQVVFCCGEVKEERESGVQNQIVKNQLEESLFHLSEEDFQNVIVAYEPVWAIGTGLTASSDQAEEMHAFIRSLIAQKYSESTAENTSILYGGSCNPTNAQELFSKENVDGGLIGGAALKADSFLAIAKSF
ncbi:MAG: triose-phosphate isomerase [Crocinitomicaceae bacterium]|nr:triose-phosphate isomerase [Crocinitomicaceae bacterium]